jgi:hypothetical protein
MDFMKKISLIAVMLLFVVLLSGCVEHLSALKPDEIPTAEHAYIYGRFSHIKKPKDVLYCENNGFNDVKLIIKEVEGKKEYAIKFKKKNDVFAVAVKPGKYFVSRWGGYCWIDGNPSSEQYIHNHVRDNIFILESGNAYYFGDFTGFHCLGGYSDHAYYFGVPDNNFEETTNDFIELYHEFDDVNKSCVFKNGFFKNECSKPHRIFLDIHHIPVPVPAIF